MCGKRLSMSPEGRFFQKVGPLHITLSLLLAVLLPRRVVCQVGSPLQRSALWRCKAPQPPTARHPIQHFPPPIPPPPHPTGASNQRASNVSSLQTAHPAKTATSTQRPHPFPLPRPLPSAHGPSEASALFPSRLQQLPSQVLWRFRRKQPRSDIEHCLGAYLPLRIQPISRPGIGHEHARRKLRIAVQAQGILDYL